MGRLKTSLKRVRAEHERDLEVLFALPFNDSYSVLVVLQSQAGIYRAHTYHTSYDGQGRYWEMSVLQEPTGNIRDVYKAINKYFAEDMPWDVS